MEKNNKLEYPIGNTCRPAYCLMVQAEIEKYQHSSVSLFMSTFTFRYRDTLMVVALISLRQVLLTCRYTCAALRRIVISPLDGLTSRQPLLDSNTPI